MKVIGGKRTAQAGYTHTTASFPKVATTNLPWRVKLQRNEDRRTDNKGAVGVTVVGVLFSYLQQQLTARVGPPGVLATFVLPSL